MFGVSLRDDDDDDDRAFVTPPSLAFSRGSVMSDEIKFQRSKERGRVVVVGVEGVWGVERKLGIHR